MKLKALMDFTLFEEKINVKKDTELFVDDVEKTVVDKDGNITLSLKRAEDVKAATYNKEPLVKIVKESKPKKQPEIETANIKTNKVEKAVKTRSKKATK